MNDASAVLAALRQSGAAQFDAIRLHYLHLLADRVSSQVGAVKPVLEARLSQALAAFQARFEQAQGDARVAVEHARQQHPDAGAGLQKLLAGGDLKGVKQAIADLKTSRPSVLLRNLVVDLEKQAAASADADLERGFHPGAGLRPELKATQYFRETWSKLSVDKRVTQALTQAPKNAGPINSHNLVLRSLALMREISPGYLNQFTSYVDTLLCLDQNERAKQLVTKPLADTQSRQKPKPRRVRLR